MEAGYLSSRMLQLEYIVRANQCASHPILSSTPIGCRKKKLLKL